MNYLELLRSRSKSSAKKLYGWKQHHALILGLTGAGKTYRSLSWFIEHGGLRVYIDTKNELADKPEYRSCFHAVKKLTKKNYEFVLDNMKEFSKNNRVIAFVPPFSKKVRNAVVDTFLQKIWETKIVSPTKLVLLIDELHAYDTRVLNTVSDITLQGRSKNLRVGLISQGYSDVPKNVRRNCLLVILLAQDDGEIPELMTEGIIPYDRDERGWRVPKITFSRKYECWAYVKDASKQLVRLYP